MDVSYKVDDNNVVFNGKHYRAIESDVLCRECAFNGSDGSGSCSGEFQHFMKRNLVSCVAYQRDDGNYVSFIEYIEKEVIDNRSEEEKSICEMILG